jgi:3-oxoacyl-[acyl-carrier protein] reductase
MTVHNLAGLLDLSGQVALITGASRGIGRALAEVFGQGGARLALMARTPAPLEELADRLNAAHGEDKALALAADVADESQVNLAVEQTLQKWGRVDVLVNNAGLISLGSGLRMELAEWERIIGANLTGAFLCSRAVVPVMERQQSGRIINIASVAAQTGGVAGGPHYSSSKGGMISMTKTFARDLAPCGVTVNAIAPGQIDADPDLLAPEARARVLELIPLGRLGEPEEIAYTALFLASKMGSYITGATIDVNGGLLKR